MAKAPIAERVALVRAFLEANGLDLSDPHLAETPERYARWFAEHLRAPALSYTLFPMKECDQMVALGPISFHTLCPHHLLPVYGSMYVAYLPNMEVGVIGLSKIARAVRHFAAGLNVQERMTKVVARSLNRRLTPRFLIVVSRAKHMCMTMRGVRAEEAITTCSVVLPPQMQGKMGLKEEAFRLWGLRRDAPSALDAEP